MKTYSSIYIVSISIGVVACQLMSCSSSKPAMAIPEEFSKEAIKMQVEGLGNGSANRSIHFGNYVTSKIKRGWNITSSRFDRNTRVSTEERVLRAFKMDQRSITVTNKDKFRFTLQGPGQFAAIYAMEKTVSENTHIEINSRQLPGWSVLKNAQYSFSAAILTGKDSITSQWQLVMYADKDPYKNKDKNFIERNSWHEEGFVSNGKDTMIIRGVKIDQVISPTGKLTTMPFAVMKAYEFSTGDEVSAIVDTFGNVIWMYKELDQATMFIVASVSSALLLRRNGIF